MKKKNSVNDLTTAGAYGSAKTSDKEEQKIQSSFGDLRSYILKLFILRRSQDLTWSVKRTRAVGVETNIEINWMK